MLRHGQDLAVDAGLERALSAARTCAGNDPAFFSGFNYNDFRTDTGSHLKADGWSFLAGLAWKAEADDYGWLAGAFFESGKGDYSAHNSFANFSEVRSSGDSEYYGGGLMARYRFPNRLRVEGSARFGRVDSDYQASGYLGQTQPKFSLKSDYYGGHFGLGYDLNLSDRTNLDLSAKYLWTRQEGQSAVVLNDPVRFEDSDSSRVRAGGRLSFAASPAVRPFAGLYGEYEFDGQAKAYNQRSGLRHDSLKTRGGTGIAEAGLSVTPTDDRNLSIDFALQGHFGRREGGRGSLTLGWAF